MRSNLQKLAFWPLNTEVPLKQLTFAALTYPNQVFIAIKLVQNRIFRINLADSPRDY